MWEYFAFMKFRTALKLENLQIFYT